MCIKNSTKHLVHVTVAMLCHHKIPRTAAVVESPKHGPTDTARGSQPNAVATVERRLQEVKLQVEPSRLNPSLTVKIYATVMVLWARLNPDLTVKTYVYVMMTLLLLPSQNVGTKRG